LGQALQVRVLLVNYLSAAKQFALLIVPPNLHQHVQVTHTPLPIPMLEEVPRAYYD
jgi:hypothetical protein